MTADDQVSGCTPDIRPDDSNGAFRPFNNFSVELFFHCLKFMPLQSLILCRTVCKDWRRLVLAYADKNPVQRRLLELYEFVAKSSSTPPSFPGDTDPDSDEREEYIEKLVAKFPTIPEEFRLWMLEWPACAVRPGQWPDDPPFISFQPLDPQNVFNLEHAFMLSIKKVEGDYSFHNTWLILDERPEHFGRIVVVRQSYSESGSHRDYDPLECEKYDDWIQYQQALWERWDGYEQLPDPEGPPDLIELN